MCPDQFTITKCKHKIMLNSSENAIKIMTATVILPKINMSSILTKDNFAFGGNSHIHLPSSLPKKVVLVY